MINGLVDTTSIIHLYRRILTRISMDRNTIYAARCGKYNVV